VASGRRVKAVVAAHAAAAEARVAAAVAAAVAAVAEAVVVVVGAAAVGAAVAAAVPVGQEGRGVAVRVDRAAMDRAGTPSAKAISWRTLSRSTASPRW
jgi:hypothetical protein